MKLPLKIAYIGVDVPGFPCFDADIHGINEALAKDHRHLRIPEGFGWTDGLELGHYGNGFLYIEGGGSPNLGNAERAFDGGPMISWPKGYRWGISCKGFSIDARGDVYKDERNHTWDIGEMYFGKWDDCQVWRSAGDGWNLHDEIQCVSFNNTISSDNRGFGYRVNNGTNVHWTGGAGACERNVEGGILWEAGPVQPYTGFGRIHQHFELTGERAIDLRGIQSVDISTTYSYLSDIVWDDTCRNLRVRTNELVSYQDTRCELIGPRPGNDVGGNTYVKLNADFSGELLPDPDAIRPASTYCHPLGRMLGLCR
jgi:hypothetical protein